MWRIPISRKKDKDYVRGKVLKKINEKKGKRDSLKIMPCNDPLEDIKINSLRKKAI